MASETIFRDASEIYARIFDHRAVLQGEQQYFVNEFETKRKEKDFNNIQQTSTTVNAMIEKLSTFKFEDTDNHLTKISANMSTALEMSRLILERDKDPDKDKWLKEQRAHRMQQWTDFVDDMCIKVAVVDKEFDEEVNNLKKHYVKLEEKLKLTSEQTSDKT